jgi:hypothetical protein
MALREAEGAAGAPWERPLHGALDKLVVESRSATRRDGRCGCIARPEWSSITLASCRAST